MPAAQHWRLIGTPPSQCCRTHRALVEIAASKTSYFHLTWSEARQTHCRISRGIPTLGSYVSLFSFPAPSATSHRAELGLPLGTTNIDGDAWLGSVGHSPERTGSQK